VLRGTPIDLGRSSNCKINIYVNLPNKCNPFPVVYAISISSFLVTSLIIFFIPFFLGISLKFERKNQ
jgi:hypothetical protein